MGAIVDTGVPVPLKESELRQVAITSHTKMTVYHIPFGKFIELNVNNCGKGEGPCFECKYAPWGDDALQQNVVTRSKVLGETFRSCKVIRFT